MKLNFRTSLVLSFIAVAIMYLLFGLTAFGLFGNNSVGQVGNATQPLIVPAGYAFSIWSIIYLGITVFPIYQAFNNSNRNELWIEVRLWFSLNVVFNGVWLVFAALDWLGLTVLVMVVLLYSLIKINLLLQEIKKNKGKINYSMECFVFSLYFAWVTLAFALNISAALHFYDWGAWNISEETWTVIIMVIAAFITGLVAMFYQDKAYAAVVVWAFLALFIKQIDRHPTIAYLALAISVLFIYFIIHLTVIQVKHYKASII